MKRIQASIGSALIASTMLGQVSPFNGLEPLGPDSTGHWRVVIGGHFHGSSNSRSGYPAATLLASLDAINATGAHLLLSTGDLFLDREADIPRYERAFFSKLAMPLYNVPGNHDHDMPGYLERFGPTHGLLRLGTTSVLLLDTERDNGDIRGEQMRMLRDLADDQDMTALLIITHRPLWAEDDKRYTDLFKGNTRSTLRTNYGNEVAPLLERIARRVPVHWISGSMAGLAPASIFFQRHADNIIFIQSAIRDEARDAVLVADIGPAGITWQGLSLTGAEMMPVEAYDAAWWRARMKHTEPFRWRLLPMHVKNAVTHRFFWWGAAAALVLALLFSRLLRRGT